MYYRKQCRCKGQEVESLQKAQGFSVLALLHRANKRQGGEWVLYEAVDGLGYEFVPGAAPNQSYRQVAQRGKILRRMAGANPASVLSHAHVTNIMQPVLNRPVLAAERQQPLRIRSQTGQTGNRQHDFNRRFAFNRAFPRDAANLLNARPGKPRRKVCQRFDASHFDAAVAFVMRRGGLQVLTARHGLLRGKQARRTRPVSLV